MAQLFLQKQVDGEVSGATKKTNQSVFVVRNRQGGDLCRQVTGRKDCHNHGYSKGFQTD